MALTEEDVELLNNKISWEGFDYAMTQYSNWEQIDDEVFHELLSQYKTATIELLSYLERNGVEFE